MIDKYDDMATVIGATEGLDETRWPGIARILRQVAHDEREACAKWLEANGQPGYAIEIRHRKS